MKKLAKLVNFNRAAVKEPVAPQPRALDAGELFFVKQSLLQMEYEEAKLRALAHLYCLPQTQVNAWAGAEAQPAWTADDVEPDRSR